MAEPEHEELDPLSETTVPARLEADLRALYSAPALPGAVDAAVLRAARERTEGRRRRRRLLIAAGPLAAAAGLAVAVWLLQPAGPGRAAPTEVALRGDLNRDGWVDILDALLLATAIRDGGLLEAAWDLTGDGRVTQADVDAIGAMAVRLVAADRAEPGGAS